MAATASQLGDWIRSRRQELGLNSDDIGRRIGVTGRTVRNIEAGKTWPAAEHVWMYERVLRWLPDTLARGIRTGQRPEVLPSEPAEDFLRRDFLKSAAVRNLLTHRPVIFKRNPELMDMILTEGSVFRELPETLDELLNTALEAHDIRGLINDLQAQYERTRAELDLEAVNQEGGSGGKGS